ncbi:MAG TPA: hypothetical protein VIF39_15430 [Hyphomicrobium sp.]|jgi:hypothetical protein
MPLQPVAAEPGLWINRDCSPTGPGLHALIIGVSRYDHLNEGVAAAPETYGLGQLSVSALTAYRFFSWLLNGYALDGWPVARVRLLMSPLRKGVGKTTTDELEGCDPAICEHAPEATFDNCKNAIEKWYADMEALRPPATGRSLFLFSGHGMERRQNYQVLLPSDFLRPPGRLINNAISTPNLADALSYLSLVSSHVLLLDGCRNDIDKLRGASGAKILNDEQPIAVNPLFEKGALYATASGLRAYSPKSGGLSLFGQALLDGLSNKPEPVLDEAPIELTRKGHVATVEINKLASYMKGRVAALIKAAKESVVQVVRSEVSSSDPGKSIDLAEIPSTPDTDKPAVGISIDSTWRSPKSTEAAEPAPASGAWFRERYQPEQKAVLAPPNAGRLEHLDRLHAIFGAESVTYPWLDKLQIVGLSTHQSFGYEAIEIISSAQAVKTPYLHRLQLHFRVAADDAVGHVLTIENERQRRFCCVLPTDVDKTIFQLEIDVEDGDYINFAAYLSPHNVGTTGRIAAAWEQLRARDPLAAVQRLEVSHTAETLAQVFRDGEEALRLKLRAPLAATVATVLLLKGNQLDRMHDWARNLANWFPTIPDGVVLWTEQCRRMAAQKPLDPSLIAWFVSELSVSLRSGPPFQNGGKCDAAQLSRLYQRG